MGAPCLDWPGLERRDAFLTEDEHSSGRRSHESGRSGSSGGFRGGGVDESSPGEWTGSSDLSQSPPCLGYGNQRTYELEAEDDHLDVPSHGSPVSPEEPDTLVESPHHYQADLSTPEYADASRHDMHQPTHTSRKRQYDFEAEEVPLDVPSTNSPVLPKDSDTWVKRPRFGEIPDFRTAKNGRKSTLELNLRKFAMRKSDEIVVPEPGMEFDSLPEAFDFFNLYSWEVGFGTRYGASRRNKQGSLTMQEILCGCAGSPRHDNTRSSVCGCKAMIRLRRTDDHGWYIHVFRKDHNHSMSVSCGEKMQWPSHKNIDPHTKGRGAPDDPIKPP